jgi:hypothetical protein
MNARMSLIFNGVKKLLRVCVCGEKRMKSDVCERIRVKNAWRESG